LDKRESQTSSRLERVVNEERREIEALIKEYKHIFASICDDLKAYKGDIIKHIIMLRMETNPLDKTKDM
jgi:hypothetical protein